MPNLLDAILAFFDQSKNRTQEEQAANAIALMQGIQDAEALAALWLILPLGVKEIGTVLAAKEVTQGRIDLQGGNGPFASVPKALFEGFDAISGEIEAAIAESLRKNLVPGSPEAKHEFDAVLDVLVDGMLQAFRVGGKEIPDSVSEALKTSLIPVLQLGLTLTVATSLAELIHPTKELGLSHISHFLYDTVGFKSISEAYTWPLRKALIEYPIQVSLNTALQPYYPSEGTITGLARKREVTRDQYRDSMRALGIREEWITGQLQGFWADPRLFEIVRILDVAMPDPVCPPEAAKWLERAELGQYTGADWWLALKFAKAGYDDIDIPVLIQAVRKRYIQSELGNIRALQRTQYKKGQISRADYEAILQKRGISAAEAQELLDAVTVERTSDTTDDLQRLYELKYANGRMSDAELAAAFTVLKLDEKYIEARTAYLVEKRLGKLQEDGDQRTLTQSQIIDAYENGTWSKMQAADRLDKQGWSMDDALIITGNAEKKMIADVQAEVIRAAEQTAKNYRLTKSELVAVYTANGKSAEWAAARADYIEELVLGKEKTE